MKRLILCADGTGNLGGTTPDSNVYRTYHLIDRSDSPEPQWTYYDNGVGTASNTYWRAFTGAFGFGFKRNVLELYEFLARNYDPGDQVFLFGFSRGAAEVRALSGLIAAAGLVDGRNMDKETLDENIKQAYRHYKHKQSGLFFHNHGAIELTFIGVWDTVSALGFPQHWKIAGTASFVFNILFHGLDWLCDKTFFAHRFHNYELTPNVRHAYQALAIDDERLSFEPKIWKEPENGKTTVEQVWFAGAHSNVGGGYGRAGLSHIALEWMLSKAKLQGLKLNSEALKEVPAKANPHGRLYNERNGLGVFYRYYPRLITDLWQEKNPAKSPIKIHRSVFERMARFSGNYAPGHLPSRFVVVSEDQPAKTITINHPQWDELQQQIQRWTKRRSYLYGAFLDVSLALAGVALWFWKWPPPSLESVDLSQGGLGAALATVLKYILPGMFDNLINLTFVQQPLYSVGAILVVVALFAARWWVRINYQEVCYALRTSILAKVDQPTKQKDRHVLYDVVSDRPEKILES